MISAIQKLAIVLLILVMVPAVALGQEERPQRGMVEAGTRNSWGDVYGRPDLPFTPSLKTSKYDEYRDLRDGFFIRRFRLNMDDIAGSKYYLDLQSDKAVYRDQSYLATFGQWNRFKLQFRYDEIPHTYSNTTRTLYTQTGNGVSDHPVADPEHPARSVRVHFAAQHYPDATGAEHELYRSCDRAPGRDRAFRL